MIDNKGNEIFSDKIGLLIARNLSSKFKNSKFVVDVKSTGLFNTDKVLLKNNCKNDLLENRSFSYQKKKLIKKKL